MIFFIRKAVASKKVMRPKQPSKLRPKKSTVDFVSPSPSCGLTFSYWNVNGLNFQAAWAIEQALTEKVLGCNLLIIQLIKAILVPIHTYI